MPFDHSLPGLREISHGHTSASQSTCMQARRIPADRVAAHHRIQTNNALRANALPRISLRETAQKYGE
ncbi:hypothetical protein BN2475_160035 [Paraburkholderia ribeironis]|uniref:Uncharacterized protein n=1 Tax=Paraburkholderia ribeironis TaxID=1247936 RepID=A0A1N7RU54_9BURK|nr:hypothetical protein BN2475_160035 [Paraburkholderia ribeironis]